MKFIIPLALALLSAASIAKAAAPAGDGVLNCTKNGNTKTVYMEAQSGGGHGQVEGVGASLKIDGVNTRALVTRSADGTKLNATVTNGQQLIQISATNSFTIYCSGPNCYNGQSLNYPTATLSKSQNGQLTTEPGFKCSLEIPVE